MKVSKDIRKPQVISMENLRFFFVFEVVNYKRYWQEVILGFLSITS